MAYPVPVSLSPSAVNQFGNCGQAFKFKYIDRLPTPDSLAMLKGNIVHDALFRFYYRPQEYAGDLARCVWEACEAEGEAAAGLLDECDALAKNIFQLEVPNEVVPMGCELRLDLPLAGHGAVGIIDRLDLTPSGDIIVVDYKTGKVPQKRDEANKLQGVMFYAMMIEEMLGVRPALVKLMYLSKPVTISAVPTDTIMRGLRMRRRRRRRRWAGR